MENTRLCAVAYLEGWKTSPASSYSFMQVAKPARKKWSESLFHSLICTMILFVKLQKFQNVSPVAYINNFTLVWVEKCE